MVWRYESTSFSGLPWNSFYQELLNETNCSARHTPFRTSFAQTERERKQAGKKGDLSF